MDSCNHFNSSWNWICLDIFALCELFPGKSIIEIGELLLGKWIGKSLGLLYALYSFYIGAVVLEGHGYFTADVSLPTTPILWVNIIMIAITLWAAYLGIETMGRISLVIIFLNAVASMISVILLIPDMDIRNLQPFMEKGSLPVLKGSFQIFTLPFQQGFLFAMLIPYLNKIEHVKKTVLLAILIPGLFVFVTNLINILVLGDLSAKLFYPTYTSFRYIQIADFLERLEILVFAVVVLCEFIKICVCLYVTALCLSQVFGTKNYRTYLVPFSILMLEFSMFEFKNKAEMVSFTNFIWPVFSIPFILLLFILMTFAIIKKRMARIRANSR